MMGGNIKVKSELGKGSEITIGLRFKTTSATKNRGVIQELNGFRALVADDNMDSCVSVEKMLRTIGLRPEWTTSGKEAVFRAKYATEQNDPFHVYIIDWLMPDMNGVEVVRRIRSEIGDEVPIIILTAYDWSDIEDEAREAGVTAFCAKPLFLSELYDVLQNSSKAGGIGGNEIIAPDTFKGRKVLLVEDVELNREIAETILQEAGIHVVCVGNGQKAVEYMSQPEADDIDLILMDIMMPVMDGITALKNLRKRGCNIPVLMLTAKTEIDDKVEGLDNGANDYLTKPFDTRELLARIRVLTRSEKQQDNVITLGNISLNTTTCELSSPSGSFLLTNKEYQMMLMFMNNKTQVISAEHFMEKIWGSESDSDISTVWTYISYLRRKLEALKSDYSIATRRNMGYYLKNNN